MTTAMLAFTVNDAIVKWLAADDGGELPLFQIVFFRGVLVSLMLGLMAYQRGPISLAMMTNRPLGVRVVLEMLGTVMFLLTLTNVPIADLAGIVQLVPLAVTFGAARLLRERVSLARVGSLALGLVGVLCIIRPGTDSFSPWYVLGLATVAIVVLRELATRSISSSVPSLVVAWVTSVAITVMGAVASAVQGWGQVDVRHGVLLLGATLALGLAYTASVTTIRTGDVSYSALFRYAALPFAIVLQLIVFRDAPDAWSIVGFVVVAVAGLWGVAQERTRVA